MCYVMLHLTLLCYECFVLTKFYRNTIEMSNKKMGNKPPDDSLERHPSFHDGWTVCVQPQFKNSYLLTQMFVKPCHLWL